jgi:phage-related protein
MPDYSKGLIYTIKTGNSVYVGSTTNFTKRKYRHKINIKTDNANLYKTIRENGGEWDMKPYKEFPCENKTQLTIEEERVRCELNADLNMKQCYGLNIEKKNIYNSNRYSKMSQEQKDKSNKKYICNICGGSYTQKHISTHKKSKKHLDKIKEM